MFKMNCFELLMEESENKQKGEGWKLQREKENSEPQIHSVVRCCQHRRHPWARGIDSSNRDYRYLHTEQLECCRSGFLESQRW